MGAVPNRRNLNVIARALALTPEQRSRNVAAVTRALSPEQSARNLVAIVKALGPEQTAHNLAAIAVVYHLYMTSLAGARSAQPVHQHMFAHALGTSKSRPGASMP
jgi:hypothetical protein